MVNFNSQSHFAVGTLGTGMALAGIRFSYDYVMNNLGLNQSEQPVRQTGDLYTNAFAQKSNATGELTTSSHHDTTQSLNTTLVRQTGDLFNSNAFAQKSNATGELTTSSHHETTKSLKSDSATEIQPYQVADLSLRDNATEIEPYQVSNLPLSDSATEIQPYQVADLSLRDNATEIEPYQVSNLPLSDSATEIQPYQVADLSLRDNATEIEPYQVADLTLRGNQFELTSGLAGGIVLHQVADLSLRGIGSSVTEGAISLVSTAVQVTESFEPPVFIGDLVMRGAEHITNFAQGPFTHQLTQISEIALSESLSIAQSCPVVNQGLAMVAAGVVIGVGAGFAGYKIAQAVNNRLKANRVKKLDLQEITTQRVVTNNNQMAGKKVRQLVTVNRGVK